MKFYLLAILYLWVFGSSIYGLFASEIHIGVSSWGFTFSGWQKNLLCGAALLIVAILPAIPVIIAVRNTLLKANK